MNCTNCGAPLGQEGRFCSGCGTLVPPPPPPPTQNWNGTNPPAGFGVPSPPQPPQYPPHHPSYHFHSPYGQPPHHPHPPRTAESIESGGQLAWGIVNLFFGFWIIAIIAIVMAASVKSAPTYEDGMSKLRRAQGLNIAATLVGVFAYVFLFSCLGFLYC